MLRKEEKSMNNYKGSILELNEKQAIVMTDNCDFVTINRQSEMFVGQQIIFNKSFIRKTQKGYMKQLSLIASVFVLIFSSIFFYQFYTPTKVFAYIDVDINPSIEFKIDKYAKVLDIEPLNDDAQILIKQLNLVDLPIKQAIAEVVKASKQYGYISADKENSILISASVKVDEESKLYEPNQVILDDILSKLKDTYSVGFDELRPQILKVTPEKRADAIKNKISMGRYELYTKIKKDNGDISVEKAKTDRVSDMLDKAKIKGNEKNKSKPNPNKSHLDKSDSDKLDSDKVDSDKIDSNKSDSANIESDSTNAPPLEKKKPDKKPKAKLKNKASDSTAENSVTDKKPNTYRSTDNNAQSPDKKDSLNQGYKSNKNKKPGNSIDKENVPYNTEDKSSADK